MSRQTLLDGYFKCQRNINDVQNQMIGNIINKKRYSLSPIKGSNTNKATKNTAQEGRKMNQENEIIDLSSDEDVPQSSKKNYEEKPIIKETPKDQEILSKNNSDSPNSSTDSSSTFVYNLSPSMVLGGELSPRKTVKNKTPNSKKFYSPTKKRLVSDKSPAKRKLSLSFGESKKHKNNDEVEVFNNVSSNTSNPDDKTQFLLCIIRDFLDNNALKKLFEKEAQVLLQNCLNISESCMRVVCRLYWRKPGWYQKDQVEDIAKGKTTISSPDLAEIIRTLLSYGILTASQGENDMTFDDYVKLIKRDPLLEICKEFKLKIQAKQNAVEALRKYSQGSAISKFFINGKNSNNSDRVIQKLKSKLGECYKLSDFVRSTLDKLYVLMYMGIDYTILTDKKLELILIHDRINKETYPIDKQMVLDNASIVFETKEQFDRYMEAHIVYERFMTSADIKERCEIVTQALKLFEEIQEEHMLRYESLPPWLRRFTPANTYVKLMENGVEELKKTRTAAHYCLAVKMLDTIIAQTSFRQHKRAKWFAEKSLILHRHLGRHDQAAKTILEGFKSDSSEEAKDILHPRAKMIAAQKNIKLDNELRLQLVDYIVEKYLVNEADVPADHVNKQPVDNENQRGKLKFKVKTKDEVTTMSAEDYCVFHYIKNSGFTHGEHSEGRIITAIFSLLFWDIIYTQPAGVKGVFMSYYQRHPLDMSYKNFYTNRKTEIDERLKLIEESSEEVILEMLKTRFDERPEHELSEVSGQSWSVLRDVSTCLRGAGLAALCGRLARDYGYSRSGFPDLTLWNNNTKQIKFVEVKTDSDKPSVKQLQWLQYLISHNIAAGFCYVGVNTLKCKARARDNTLTS